MCKEGNTVFLFSKSILVSGYMTLRSKGHNVFNCGSTNYTKLLLFSLTPLYTWFVQ